MIRQAISCDICGTDKQQTNHWFVAYELNGELRISGWSAHSRLRPSTKHLCGQICLHKLVDEFMAKTIAVRGAAAETRPPKENTVNKTKAVIPSRTDSNLTAVVAHPVPVCTDDYMDEFESSARLITPEDSGSAPATPVYSSHAWHVEAWKREREREQCTTHRRSIA